MNMKKASSAAMAAIMALSMSAMPAFAADQTSASTKINATVAHAYTVTVPQEITLVKASGTGTGTYEKSYTVNVKGDIAEDESVTVKAANPTLACSGSTDVTATMTEPKTAWNRTELNANSNAGTDSTWKCSAELTPGTWTGTATYSIALVKTASIK